MCQSLSENPRIELACTRAGISRATFYSWLSQSQAGEPGFELEWCGQVVPLHVAVALSRRMVIMEAVARMEERALNGHEEISMWHGAPVYQIDERYEHCDDETLAILGVPDRYLRDPVTGEKVPYKIHYMPPTQLVLAVAGAHFPKLYGNHQSIEVTNKSGGVHVVKHEHKLIKPPVPVVEALPAPVEDAVFEEVPAEPVTMPEPAIVERVGISDLERDLLAKLAAGPKNPRPSGLVNTCGGSSPRADDPQEGGA